MNREENNLLVKWLDATATEEEVNLLSADIDLDGLKRDISIVDKNIHFNSVPVEQSWEVFQQKLQTKTMPKSKTRFLWLSILSILLLIGSYVIYQSVQKNTEEKIATNIGDDYAGWLPDSSSFHLNAISSLSFKPRNWSNSRTVKLSGQAYFDVKKGSSFTVKTDDGTVKVLGTKFDIAAYGLYMTVTCYEGKVEVLTSNNASKVLNAGQQVSVKDGHYYDLKTINDFTSDWRDKNLKFENLPLQNVLTELKKYYDYSFQMNVKHKNRYFTGQVPTNDIQKSLELIFAPLDIPYDFSNKELVF